MLFLSYVMELRNLSIIKTLPDERYGFPIKFVITV